MVVRGKQAGRPGGCKAGSGERSPTNAGILPPKAAWMRKAYRVFVDDTLFTPEGQRGVNRCFLEYSRALAEAFPGQVAVRTRRSAGPPGLRVIRPLWDGPLEGPIGARAARLQDRLTGLQAAMLADAYYSPFYGHVRTAIPQVFSAYDMIYEKLPHYFAGSPDYAHEIGKKRRCFERARLIICISQSTANDILEAYPQLDPRRVVVNHLGVDDLFLESRAGGPAHRPYFLYVGHRSTYKNFLRLLRAYGRSGLASEFDLRVVAPVEAPFTRDELDAIGRYGLAGRVQMEADLPDEMLAQRYGQAHAFVCPSEYEGFGLPLLEAMASGTLALASNTSSLPEVGGDVPLYFDPLSEDAIVEALLGAAHMPAPERRQRIEGGRARAAGFTWQASRTNFLRAFQTLL